MSEEQQSRIVVGVDGSPSSIEALRWALHQAEATGARVLAVQAWEVPYMYGVGAVVLPGDQFATAAEGQLQEAIEKARASGPDVPIDSLTVSGHPARVLIEHSKDAALLVVGSRGHGGFVGMLIGSVSQYCIQHATCPVVVTRGEK